MNLKNYNMSKFSIIDTKIPDVKLIKPEMFHDNRGIFIELFNKTEFEAAGIPTNFVQMNFSRSHKDVVRGLHFQYDPPMGKLMRVIKGYAYLVAVDIRKNSPTYGKYHGGMFNSFNQTMIWAPAGFARGIYSLEDDTEIQYLVTGEYNPAGESQIKWNDKDLDIAWPYKCKNTLVSEKDKNAMSFKDWTASEISNKFMI
jgi:dTDP-4-dehydrorhamnose 3,5-epimerase